MNIATEYAGEQTTCQHSGLITLVMHPIVRLLEKPPYCLCPIWVQGVVSREM